MQKKNLRIKIYLVRQPPPHTSGRMAPPRRLSKGRHALSPVLFSIDGCVCGWATYVLIYCCQDETNCKTNQHGNFESDGPKAARVNPSIGQAFNKLQQTTTTVLYLTMQC